jgi:diamine N-acetyltransferase
VNANIALEPITPENVRAVYDLAVADGQDRFVAPNSWSLAQALAGGDLAWPRAVSADGEIVGFLMLEIDPVDPKGRTFWLWRLMIAAEHQRRGFGVAAVALAANEVRRRGGTDLWTSWIALPGGPEDFYRRLGFEPTGDLIDGEVVGRLPLDPAPAEAIAEFVAGRKDQIAG